MGQEPTPVRRAAPLTGRERRLVAAAALGPVVLAGLVLLPLAAGPAVTLADVGAAALVYGGLLGLAAGVVTTDRLQARQCPRCGDRHARGSRACDACGYDLAQRPRFACSERHQLFLEEGLCPCGRRLHALPPPAGVGRQVVASLRIGAWLLAFLVAVGLLLRFLEGRF